MKHTYKILLLFAFVCGMLFPSNIVAQEKKQAKIIVSSFVKDENGAPIVGAKVFGQEGAVVTKTDATGHFSIEIPASTNLLIEAKGYQSRILNVKSDDTVVLTKMPFLMTEDDVINIPFTKIKRGEVVNGTSAVSTQDILQYDNFQTVTDLIQSRVAGLLGSSNIRGIGDALIVVDGIPRDPSMLNIEEIDQITVLKDVNASVLYGTQAKNGIIYITTKRGKAQKREINISVEQGMSFPKALPRYLSSAEYMELYNEALTNDGLGIRYDADLIEKYRSGSNIYRYPNVDYYSDEFLKSFRNTTKVITEFSGGNEHTRYYTNLGWTNWGSLFEQGQAQTTNRFNVRGNIDFKITDYISSHLDAVVVFDLDKGPNGDFWNNAATLHPYYYSPLIPLSMINDPTLAETAKLVNGQYVLGGTTQYQDNVYGNMYLGGYLQNIQRTAQFNGGVDFDIDKWVKGLKFKTYLSFDFYNQYSQSVDNEYAVYSPVWGDNDEILSLTKINEDVSTGVQNLGSGSLTRRVGFYGMFDYDRTFKDVHRVSGSLLGFYNTVDQNDVLLTSKYAHLGLRLAYNYAQRYFVDFSSNYSHSVKLPTGNRGGFSPTLGLGWVVSNEDFWKDNNILNYLKLKLSGGVLKTDENIGTHIYNESYWYDGSFSWGDGDYSGNITYAGRSANPNLTYEKMKNINVGFESYWFNKQLSLETNFFYNRYSDQVLRRYNYYPSFVSVLFPDENYEEDSYTGVEIGAVWSRSIGDFSFDLGANLLYATSKVLKEDELWANDYQYRKGNSTDAQYGLVCLGFYESQEDIDNSPQQKFGEVKPGDLKYADLNNDDIIDDNDQMKIGNSQARFSYGINLNLKYKDFSLFISGEGRSGYDYFQSGDYFWIDGNDKYSEVVWDRWTPETAATATYPRLSSKASDNNFRNSTFWLRNGRYFNLSRVQLTYSFPEKLLAKTPLKGVNIYLRGADLLMVSKNARLRQLNIGTEPQYRNFALGARVMF